MRNKQQGIEHTSLSLSCLMCSSYGNATHTQHKVLKVFLIDFKKTIFSAQRELFQIGTLCKHHSSLWSSYILSLPRSGTALTARMETVAYLMIARCCRCASTHFGILHFCIFLRWDICWLWGHLCRLSLSPSSRGALCFPPPPQLLGTRERYSLLCLLRQQAASWAFTGLGSGG